MTLSHYQQYYFAEQHDRDDNPYLARLPVLAQLGVDLLHPLHVDSGDESVVHHGLGIVHADDALSRPLDGLWRRPRLVQVARGKVLQDRQVSPREQPVITCLD
jgi:hypothetical protein